MHDITVLRSFRIFSLLQRFIIDMVLEVDVNHDSVKKLEKFLGTGKYKDLAVNTQSFSRKLNEERKMRIPYVDGQVRTLAPVDLSKLCL